MIKTIDIGCFFSYLWTNKKILFVSLILSNLIACVALISIDKSYYLKAYYYVDTISLGNNGLVFWNDDRSLLNMIESDLKNYSLKEGSDKVGVIRDHRSDRVEIVIKFDGVNDISEMYHDELNLINEFLNDRYKKRIKDRLDKLSSSKFEVENEHKSEIDALNDRLFFLESLDNSFFTVDENETILKETPGYLLVAFWLNVYGFLIWLAYCYFRFSWNARGSE